MQYFSLQSAMGLLKYCILFLFLQLTKCEECVLDKTTLEIAFDNKLKKDIFCNYDSAKPPIENGTILVKPYIIVRFFRFTQNEETFSLNVWIILQYDDDRLKWNPVEYDGLTRTRQNFYHLWTPTIELLNNMELNSYGPPYETSCEILHYGKVACTYRMLFETHCSTKLKDWPYDIQTCTLKFGKSKKNVVFTFDGSNRISSFGFENGTGWNIIDYKTNVDPKNKVQMTLTFVLERQAFGLAAMIVVPSIIVFVLTITTLVLNVKGYIRIFLAGFSVLLHHYLLQTISEEIPKHSADPPSILMFVRDSLSICVIVVILTFILSYLCKKDVPAPAWVTTVNVYVLKSKLNYFIWPRWEFKEANVTKEKRAIEEWNDFANIVNSFCLIVFMFIYVVLFSINMPKPPSVINPL